MSRLRLGIIGAGSVVREIYQHLYSASDYSDQLAIVAVAEPDASAREQFGDQYGLAAERRFADSHGMFERCELDAVHVNTPDHLHEAPVVDALDHGLDVLVPKPLADSIPAAHRMIAAARRNHRLLGVDFHKRNDPRIREAARRYRAGHYGEFQFADWHMLDRLMVSDPNHQPRFFATADFAEKNTPISFLTVHMADSLMQVIGLKPVAVRAIAWSQKLPSLRPLAVAGYDLCDTEVRFENNGLAHFVTGWHLPNPARSITVESTKTICTDGVIELLDAVGYEELTHQGIASPHVLFQSRGIDGKVRGFGMSVPGELLRTFARFRAGQLSPEAAAALLDPFVVGFWPTAIVEAAHLSLERGRKTTNGVTFGEPVDLPSLIRERLGESAGEYF